MKAIILARVSTEEQKEAGNSLPAQIARLKNYCNTKNIEILKIFSFDESAYKTKRDNFDEIIEYIKSVKEKTAVCFDKVDRFSRNIFDKRVSSLYDLAMKDKIELHFSSDNLIITPNISATEKFHFGINLGLAKYYSDAISDSVKRIYENKVRQGIWTGRAPLGYVNTTDDKGTKDIIPDPSRSHLIVKMFELYATGNYSIKQVASELEKLGLKSKTKNSVFVGASKIHEYLKNPFYYGTMKRKGQLYPHKYQSLISKELFDKCQDIMAGYHKKPFKYASKPFIFRGLIKCADCGRVITPELHKKKHIYYHCTNYKKIHQKIDYVKEEELLSPIYELLKNIQMSDEKINEVTEDLKKINQTKNKFHQKSLSSLRQEYDKIDKKISNAFEILADDKECITKDIFNSKLKEWKERQAELQLEMAGYTDADEKFYLTANMVLNLAKRAYEIFKSSEVSEKRQLLNYLLLNAELKGKKLLFKLKTPFDTMLQANKCSEWGP